jgi:hypothetical protein
MAVSAIALNGNVVVMESDLDGSPGREFNLAILELNHPDTIRKAAHYAALNGIPSPGVGMPEYPYPVDDRGNEVVDARAQRIYRYRREIPVSHSVRTAMP